MVTSMLALELLNVVKMVGVVKRISRKLSPSLGRSLPFSLERYTLLTSPDIRRAAALTHPGAMHRLGIAELNGELGLTKRPREGVKWLKRSAEIADQVDPPQPQSLHELAILHEKGIENVVFKVSRFWL